MSKTSPAISVLLTTYNQAQWLAQAIDSVLAQTQTLPHGEGAPFEDFELVVVDNGSTDDTPAVCARYTADPRVRVIRYEKNDKHTVISNAALRDTCRGEFVSFLYGDDYYLPEKLATQLAFLRSLPASVGGVYCSSYVLHDATGELEPRPCGTLRGLILDHMIVSQPFMPVAPLVRRACLLETPFYEELFMEGEGIFVKVAMSHEWEYQADTLCVMRQHGENMGHEIDAALERCVRLFDHYFALPQFPAGRSDLKRASYAHVYALKGWEAIRTERRYRTGRAWIATAIRHDPRVVARVRVLLGLAMGLIPQRGADAVIDWMNRRYGAPVRQPTQGVGA